MQKSRDYSKSYAQHWVWIDNSDCHRGWDGIDRIILRDGTVIELPPYEDDDG